MPRRAAQALIGALFLLDHRVMKIRLALLLTLIFSVVSAAP